MLRIHICQQLQSQHLDDSLRKFSIIAGRKLSANEIACAKEMNLNWYYCPPLSAEEQKAYFGHFKKFWDQVIDGFGPQHHFWRNVVSSKMQEWERSCAYRTLILFTLNQQQKEEDINLIVVPGSSAEADVWHHWANDNHWDVLKNDCGTFSSRIFQEMRNVARGIFYFLDCIRKKGKAGHLQKPHGFSFLIVSLFYKKSLRKDSYHDPFFGDLHKYINKNESHCAYLLDCLDPVDARMAKDLKQCQEVDLFFIYSVISWKCLCAVFMKMLCRKIKWKHCIFFDCDLSRLLMWKARSFDTPFNLYAEIFYEGVKQLCQESDVHQMLFLFEGNAYERAAVQAFRECSAGDVRGYSHAVIYPLNLKLHVTDKELKCRPQPDVLISAGNHTKELLEKLRGGKGPKIAEGCSLRHIPEILPGQGGREREYILIALDGTWSAVQYLNWIFDHADVFKDYKVCLRAHPNVGMDMLLSQCLLKKPSHFEVSGRSLKGDFNKSFCVIYRQSSLGIQALFNHIPAVYLNVDQPLSGDPIEKVRGDKYSVSTKEELQSILQELYQTRDKKRDGTAGDNRRLKEYFSKPTDQAIESFIKKSQ
ncbi:MAG: hypothetical protein KAR05_01990 [Candidatus Omnitrophica bacterium]|nr:hypothetical protein [Candidatus Omnitrophota bacterium]